VIENLSYSIAGLTVGFVVGKWVHCYRKGLVGTVYHRRKQTEVRPRGDANYDPTQPIPTVIPAVRFDPSTGEPLIATEEIHKDSPIPRSVTIIVILLAAISLVYIAVSKSNEAHDAKTAQDRLAAQVEANRALTLLLQHQQGIITANEKRLEDLVLAISTAKTPGEVTAAIQRFLKSSSAAHAREQKYQQEHGGNASGSVYCPGCNDTGGSTSPSPRPQSSRSPSNSHSPSPSHSPHPSHSPRPSPSPTGLVCVVTPAGRICTPATSPIPP
jgi:hypothetical protein